MYAAEGVSDEQKTMAKEILGSVGLTFWFAQEKELDAVTAVSGSGPAYFFLLMESLIEAAKAQGLDPATARQMVLQTAWGQRNWLWPVKRARMCCASRSPAPVAPPPRR